MSRYCPYCGCNDLQMAPIGCGVVCPACHQKVVPDPSPPSPRSAKAPQPLKVSEGTSWNWIPWLVVPLGIVLMALVPFHPSTMSSADRQQLENLQRELEANREWNASLASLDPEARSRVEMLREFQLKHWGSKDGELLVQAVKAKHEIDRILALGRLPDDPQSRVRGLEWDLKQVASEREQLERRVTPYDLLPRESNIFPNDPYLQAVRDGESRQRESLREKEMDLRRQIEGERERGQMLLSPTQMLQKLHVSHE